MNQPSTEEDLKYVETSLEAKLNELHLLLDYARKHKLDYTEVINSNDDSVIELCYKVTDLNNTF